MKLDLDSNKLIYHLDRLLEWQKNPESVFPVYAEIGITNACNHKCVFCALDYCNTGVKPVYYDFEKLKNLILQLSECGVKSVLYAGAGEPLMHKFASDIISFTYQNRIDTALSTNFVLFNREFTEKTLGSLTWVRASINAADSETYALIHRCNEADFNRVIKNLEYAVKFRNLNNLKTSIGVQAVLLKENIEQLIELNRIVKNTGADYFSVKAFNPHNMSVKNKNSFFYEFNRIDEIRNQLESEQTDKFKVFFRKESMVKVADNTRTYNECLGSAFTAFIRETGDVFSCIAAYDNNKFVYGNLNENSFKEIWLSEKRKKINEYINSNFAELKKNFCRPTCRLDSINRFLDKLNNPPEHINFI